MAKVEDFVAWTTMWWCYRQLKGITEAGYNYSPFVTMNVNDYKNAAAKTALLLECGSHDGAEVTLGGETDTIRVEQQLQLVIRGSVTLEKDEYPRKAAFALEQDVRKVLHTSIKDMRAALGRGFTFRFGGCQHDAGTLTPDNEAGFRLFITYGYPHGSGW